jgi:ankyrin repeat protein
MVLGRFLGGGKEAAAPAPAVADMTSESAAPQKTSTTGDGSDNNGVASNSSTSAVTSSQSAQTAVGGASAGSSSSASQPPPFSAAAGFDANNDGAPPSTPNSRPTFSFTANNNNNSSNDDSNGEDGSSSNKKMKRNGQAVAGPQQPPGRGIFQFTSNTATTASPQGGAASALSAAESGNSNANSPMPMTSAAAPQFSSAAGGVGDGGGAAGAAAPIPMSPSNTQSSCSADNAPSQPNSPCHATASSSSAWTPQTLTTTCEFTHLIENYSQKRDSGCKKAEYSQITTDSHGNKWRFIIYVNGNGRASNHHLSLFLQVADAEALPFGWNKAVSYVLTLEHPDGSGNDNSSSSSSTNNNNNSNNNNSSSPQHQQQQNTGYSKRNPDKTFKMCPKAIDWGWSQFITSDRIQQEGYVRSDDALVVRASVTVKSSSVTIDPEDAELYLKCAVEEGNADAVRVCLKQNARVNCQFKDDLYTPLHTACSATGDGGQSSSSNSSAASSISNGDMNNNGKSNDNSPGPVSPGNLEVLDLLLEKGADVNACNKWRETPLLIAANNGHVEAVKALLKSGADPSLCSEAGWSALTFAAHKGYSDIVRLLLAAKAPVNCRVTEDLSTPLHKACAGSKPGHLSAVTQLLGGNADVHALNKWRETPLLTAANHGQDKAVGELLRYGADPCKCTDTGWSPLSIAAYKGHDEVVRLLLEEGAPTEEDDPTLSALLQAATKGLPETCILLLRHGADHTVTTKKGDTALAILVEQDMIDAAVEMVTDYNASIPRCSRDRKKVQRARLLINLRLKQHKREGTGPYADNDFSDGGESDDADVEGSGSAVALHDAAIPQTMNDTAATPKSKKKKGKKSIAKAEEDARAAEEALLLELEAEENAKTESSKSSKKKKKKKDRERQLKAEKAKEEEIQKAAAAAAAAEKAAKAKEEPAAAAKAKKEKVVELTSASQPIALKSDPKSKKKDSPSSTKKSNRNKEMSLPTSSSLPTPNKKQADAKLNLKWAEGKDVKPKKAGESSVAKSETAKKSTVTSKKTITPKKIPGDNPIPKKIPGDNPLPKRIPGDNPIQPKKIPGDNPKVPMQQSRVPSTPKPVAKTVATPKNKRGWESKASTPNTGASQNGQQVAKGRSKDNSSIKETRKGGQSSKSPSVTPDSLNASKVKVRSDESTHSTENSTTDSLPVTPNPPQRSNTHPRVSVDDQLANMANDVLGFLDFESQPPRQNNSDVESNSIKSDSYHGASGFDVQTPPPTLNPTANFVSSPPTIPPLVSSISVELPPVSVFRLEKLHELFRQCSDARSSPNNHPLRVIDERTLRTVLYRWIIRASHGSDSFLDPVIPSWEDKAYLKEYLQRQFISESRRSVDDTRYKMNVPSIEVLRDAGASMSELCRSLAKEVVEFRSKCEQQVPPNWTDSNINVAGMEDGSNVVIDWSGKSRLSIPLSLFNSLVRRHVGQQNRLMSAVFSAVRRHEIIAAIADQTEMVCHLPPQSVDFLTRGLNASLETFSDSVSVRGNNYFCAMFPDVDTAFGGLSPFGKDNGGVESVLTRSGASVIVVAPPENNASSQCCRTIVDMVESHVNVPLSFGVVLSSDCFVNATRTLSADHLRALDPRLCGDQNGFISFIEVVPAGSCNFSKSSSMFLLIQNEAGKRHFPLNQSSIDIIRRSMRSDVSTMSSVQGVQNEPIYDASAYSPRSPAAPQPTFASVSQEMAFPSNPWESAPASGRRGGGHRGRLFELVDGEDGEDDHGMSTVLPGMLNNLNMDMFGGSTNSSDEIDIEAISLMGIGLNGNLGERFST